MSPRNKTPPVEPRGSTTPFGRALAARVADMLFAGGRVNEGWSAHWMIYRDGAFIYEVLKGKRRVVFSSLDRKAFVTWLAEQSTASLDKRVRPGTTDTIELITRAMLQRLVAREREAIDPTPYGHDLAARVADALDGGRYIAYAHRDYCGMGLVRLDGRYVYSAIVDGYPTDPPEQSFELRDDFVAWLAAQSDVSLRGEGGDPFGFDNQRMTRARMLAVVEAAGA